MSREQLAVAIMIVGLGLVLLARPLADGLARLWGRLGMEVPPSYTRQFRFVGVVVTAIGFLLAMGWLEKL